MIVAKQKIHTILQDYTKRVRTSVTDLQPVPAASKETTHAVYWKTGQRFEITDGWAGYKTGQQGTIEYVYCPDEQLYNLHGLRLRVAIDGVLSTISSNRIIRIKPIDQKTTEDEYTPLVDEGRCEIKSSESAAEEQTLGKQRRVLRSGSRVSIMTENPLYNGKHGTLTKLLDDGRWGVRADFDNKILYWKTVKPLEDGVSLQCAMYSMDCVFQNAKTGLQFDTNDRITMVEVGSQGERLGVQAGWIVSAVNSRTPSDSDSARKLIRVCRAAGVEEINITFMTSDTPMFKKGVRVEVIEEVVSRDVSQIIPSHIQQGTQGIIVSMDDRYATIKFSGIGNVKLVSKDNFSKLKVIRKQLPPNWVECTSTGKPDYIGDAGKKGVFYRNKLTGTTTWEFPQLHFGARVKIIAAPNKGEFGIIEKLTGDGHPDVRLEVTGQVVKKMRSDVELVGQVESLSGDDTLPDSQLLCDGWVYRVVPDSIKTSAVVETTGSQIVPRGWEWVCHEDPSWEHIRLNAVVPYGWGCQMVAIQGADGNQHTTLFSTKNGQECGFSRHSCHGAVEWESKPTRAKYTHHQTRMLVRRKYTSVVSDNAKTYRSFTPGESSAPAKFFARLDVAEEERPRAIICSEDRVCEGGHMMQRTRGLPRAYRSVSCDACQLKKLQQRQHFYHCQPCQYDLCQACSDKRAQQRMTNKYPTVEKSPPTESILVAGAGAKQFNGTYIRNGDKNGHSYWKKNGSAYRRVHRSKLRLSHHQTKLRTQIIWSEHSYQWIIDDPSGPAPYNRPCWPTTADPPTDGWQVYQSNGRSPIPMLTYDNRNKPTNESVKQHTDTAILVSWKNLSDVRITVDGAGSPEVNGEYTCFGTKRCSRHNSMPVFFTRNGVPWPRILYDGAKSWHIEHGEAGVSYRSSHVNSNSHLLHPPLDSWGPGLRNRLRLK